MSETPTQICNHGSLRRQCEICDLIEVVEKALGERDEARTILAAERAAHAQQVKDEQSVWRAANSRASQIEVLLRAMTQERDDWKLAFETANAGPDDIDW